MEKKKPRTVKSVYRVRGDVWLYPSEVASWHFFSIPKRETERIVKECKPLMRGWGSLPVEVTIKKTTWNTSIFLDRKSGTFLLPLKASVRKKEEIGLGDVISVSFEIQV